MRTDPTLPGTHRALVVIPGTVNYFYNQNGRRIGKAARFDYDTIEGRHCTRGSPRGELHKSGCEVASHFATQAAIRNRDQRFRARLDELVVEPDLSELVDDDGCAAHRGVTQQASQQRCLAAAEEACDYRNGSGSVGRLSCRNLRFGASVADKRLVRMLGHRIWLGPHAAAHGLTPEAVIRDVINEVPIP